MARIQERDTSSDMVANDKGALVSLLALIVFVGTWANTIFHYVEGVYLQQPYPLNTFLFRPEKRFSDFLDDFHYAGRFLTGKADVITYTPFSHFVMSALHVVSDNVALVASIALFLGTVVYMVWRFFLDTPQRPLAEKLLVLLVLVTMSYPVLFAVDRANQEMFVFILLFWFAYFYYVKPRPWLAVVFITAAAALKIYPGVFIVLLIADRRWRESIAMALGVVGLWITSAFAIGVASGRGVMAVYSATMTTLGGESGQAGSILKVGYLNHRHTFWSVIALWHWVNGRQDQLHLFVKPYAIAALIVFLGISAYVIFIETEPWKRFTMLAIAMLTLPYMSTAYNLTEIYVPLMLFLLFARRTRFRIAYLVLFALTLIPLDYWVLKKDASISVLLHLLCLVGIAVLIMVERLMDGRPAAIETQPSTDILA